jgi:SPP1 family predicted phage head-tail adaptor
MKGKEMFSADQVQSDVDHRIVTRNRSELSALGPADRATWNGRTFDIRSVIWRDPQMSELEILATVHN